MYCIVLYCIVLYLFGISFLQSVDLAWDQFSAISGSCLGLGGRGVATMWLPRCCNDVVAAVAARLQRKRYRVAGCRDRGV